MYKRVRVILNRCAVTLMVSFGVSVIGTCGTVFGTIDPNSYTLNWSMTNQNVGINIMDISETDKYVSISRTISLSTNAPSGYRIYVNIPSSEESGGDLTLAGGSSSNPKISMLNTTPTTASTLSTGTWGFGIPSGTTGLPTNNFSSTYASGTPSTSSTYSGVEIGPEYTLIRERTGTISGTESFDIYYGMRVGYDVMSHPGTYATNIEYHAMIDATDVVGGEATILPVSGPKSGYENVTITTSLMTDFVPNDISVTIGDQTCDSPRGNISTGVLRVNCVTRAHSPGLTDVVVILIL